MRQKSLFTMCHSTLLSVTVVFALILSFGVHSVEMVHTHPGHAHVDGSVHAGDPISVLSVNEYIHANEQKLFMFILVSVLILGSLYLPSFLQFAGRSYKELIQRSFQEVIMQRRHYNTLRHKVFLYLLILFRKGILHPKAY